MKSISNAIEVLEKAAKDLDIEKRMWEKQPNSEEVITKVEEEKQEVMAGLEILKDQR